MVVDMNAGTLACDMNVFTPVDREMHMQSTRDLLAAVQGTHEVETGFEIVFPNRTALITKLAEFISKERLCCPFLEFTLRIGPNEQPISLTLTGLEGTKAFLREEFSEVMA